MKKKFILTICLTAVIPLIVCGCGSSTNENNTSLPTGTVEAREVDLNAKIPGRVVNLLVTEGDEVKPEQIVAELDDKDLKAKEAQALATVQAAKAQIQEAQTARTVTENTVKAALQRAQATLEEAQAREELAAQTLARIEILFEQGAIPQQQLDESRAQAKAAAAARAQAEAALAEAQASQLKIDLAGDQIATAAARLEQAQAALTEIRNNLAELKIKSPTAGTVTAVNIEQGELVSTGLPVVTVTDFKDNWVEMQVNQDIVQTLKLHQKAQVSAADQQCAGEIVKISSKPAFATRRATSDRGDKDIVTYEVRISLKDPSLRPGMNVEVEFINQNETGGGQDAA